MKQYILIVWNTLCKYEAEFHKRCDVLIKSNSVDEQYWTQSEVLWFMKITNNRENAFQS